MNRMKKLIGALYAVVLTAGVGFGATNYVWTGVVDQNWSNAANWDANGIPADDAPGAVGTNQEGISLPQDDTISFSGSVMPTNNLPGIGGLYDGVGGAGLDQWNTPTMIFNSGGAISINVVGHDNAIWTNPNNGGASRNIMTVGDGTTGVTENVTVNWSGGDQMSRHNDGNVFNFIINADGTLNRTGGLDFSRGINRVATMTINGGSVVASGSIYDLTNIAGPVINFSALGASLQAGWGGNFADLTAVKAAMGTYLVNNSGVAGSELVAMSVGGGWKVELLSSNEVANLYTTYTWTGAVDGNWSNVANWDANGIPVDDTADTTNKYAGLTMPYKDSIVFAGTMMPTSNIPEIGGWYDSSSVQGDSPTMVFNSGGEISFNVTGEFAAFLTNPANDERSVLTVGDGIGGGTEDVIVNVSVGQTNSLNGSLNRHNNGTHDYTVKSDGTLNIENAVTNFVDLSYNTTLRPVIFAIDGGAVGIHGAVKDLSGNCKVSFTSGGGTFTAQYGQDFPTLTDVVNSLGTAFENATGNPFFTLLATDVGGTNFMVSVTSSINWGSAKTIDSDMNVSLRGTLAYAYNCGSASASTITGVTFAATGGNTASFGTDVSLTAFNGTTAGFGSIYAPYTDLSIDYQTLLSTAVTNGSGTSTITLNNLTPNKQYLVQVWVSDSSAANGSAQTGTLAAGTANETNLNPANPVADGGVGQYAIGTFLAGGSSQAFELQSNRLQLNGIQVREINDVNVGFWTGIGGSSWDASTTANFADNAYNAALNNTTFNVAKAANGTVTFADAYWDNGATVAVTNSTVAISGPVEATRIYFENSTVDYSLSGTSIAGASEVVISGGGTVNFGNDVLTSTGNLTVDNSTLIASRFSMQSHTGAIILDNGVISEANGNEHLQLNYQKIILAAGGGTLKHVHARNIYNIGEISGTGQLTLQGVNSDAGRVQLATANTYTGGTVIRDGGQGWAYSDASFGAADTPVTCINNGDIQLVNNLSFGNRAFSIESGTTDIKGGKAVTINGPISGAGGLNLTSGGSAILSGTNTYAGATTISRYTRVTYSLGAGDISLNAQLQNNDSVLTFANNFIFGDGAELKAGWTKDITINGDLSGSATNVNIVADSGAIYLNGNGSSYTGAVSVASGAKLGGVGSLGGVLSFAGTNSTFLVNADAGSMTIGGDLNLNNATLSLTGTVGGAGVTLATVGGTINGIFDGYPEGAEVVPGYTISYLGGAIKLSPTSPFESPTVTLSISGGVIGLSWPSSIVAGDQFNVLTNVDLVFGSWGTNTSMVPFLDGGSYKVTNSVGNAPQVFYKLEGK